MAVRIRANGDIFCAALSKPFHDDVYIDDHLHEMLSLDRKIMVTTEHEHHMATGGKWWWKNQVPDGVLIDKFHL